MALSVKYTALLLLPLIAAAIAVLSVSLTACTLYLWVGVMSRLDSIPLDSPPLKSLANYAPSFRLPIPRAILTGIDPLDRSQPAEYLTVRRQGADVAIRETAAEPSRGVATAGVPER